MVMQLPRRHLQGLSSGHAPIFGQLVHAVGIQHLL